MNDTFIVNQFTTIENFKRLNEFTDFLKFGQYYTYEKFTGILSGDKIQGYICLADENIYKLEHL